MRLCDDMCGCVREIKIDRIFYLLGSIFSGCYDKS
jgi:hypothetical protein